MADKNLGETAVDIPSMIRVNQAGEYGAAPNLQRAVGGDGRSWSR